MSAQRDTAGDTSGRSDCAARSVHEVLMQQASMFRDVWQELAAIEPMSVRRSDNAPMPKNRADLEPITRLCVFDEERNYAPARGSHWPCGSFLSASPSRMAPVMWLLSVARNRTAETTSDRRLFGWSEGLCPLAAASPPSIRKSAPFTKLLSSQARNRAAAATSSGRPIRPSGIAAVSRALSSAEA